jgi:hypothetical protein
MNTTGIFEIYSYPIRYAKSNEPIYLIPFGDVHRSSPLCHVEKWKEFLDWAKKKPRSYFLGMGDYDDLLSASERKILDNDDIHESTRETLEQFYRSKTEKLAKELEFMRGRLVGLLEGNHFVTFDDGTTSTQYLCKLLGCKYLGCTAFVRMWFSSTSKRLDTHGIDLWAYHGKGAARLVGGSLNTVQQMCEQAEADIYLMGHDHKKSTATITRLKLNRGSAGNVRLSHRKCLLARTGSFLKGYVPGKRSYVVDKNLNPTDLGVVKIELTPKRHQDNGDDWMEVDLHASI